MNNQHPLYNPQILGSSNVNIELLAQAQTMQTVPVQYTYTTDMTQAVGHTTHAVNLAAAPAHIVTTAQEVQAVGGIPVVYQATEVTTQQQAQPISYKVPEGTVIATAAPVQQQQAQQQQTITVQAEKKKDIMKAAAEESKIFEDGNAKKGGPVTAVKSEPTAST